MKTTNDFMGTKPVLPLLLSMSVPMMLSMLIQALYNIVDSIYISRLGTQALTAVSLAFPLQNITIAVSVGVGVGISSAISIYLGAKNQEKADRAATIGIALSLVHCIFFLVFGLLVTRPFLSLFTNDVTTLELSCQYTYIVMCVSFGCLLQLAMEKIFQAVGAMKETMLLLASGCIINIILDPILIFGLLGFPSMGITGAAIATVIGQIAAFLLYIVVYLKKRKRFPVAVRMSALCWDKEIIKRIYSVGIPSTIMMLLPSVLISLLNRLLINFSELYVAVLGVYFKLQTFIYMPANGIVQGMRPIIGFNYGAGNTKRVKSVIRYSLLCSAAIMLAGTIAAMAFPAQIFSMFDAEEALLSAGTTALRVISCGFLVSTIGIIYSGVFESLGMGKHSLAISLLRQFIITLPLSLCLPQFIGVAGIWAAFPIAELCASLAAIPMLRKVEGGNLSPF